MAAVVMEDQLPVVYDSWEDWRREKVRAAVRCAPLAEPDTHSCPACWGQRKIFTPAANGEGLIPMPCMTCLARGIVSTV